MKAPPDLSVHHARDIDMNIAVSAVQPKFDLKPHQLDEWVSDSMRSIISWIRARYLVVPLGANFDLANDRLRIYYGDNLNADVLAESAARFRCDRDVVFSRIGFEHAVIRQSATRASSARLQPEALPRLSTAKTVVHSSEIELSAFDRFLPR